MLFRPCLIFLYLIFSWGLLAQTEPLPKTLPEFTRLFLAMKAPKTPEDLEKERLELFTKRINEQFGIKPKKIDSKQQLSSLYAQTKMRDLMDCLRLALQGKVMSGFDCRADWNAIRLGDLEALKRRGIELPEEFKQKLSAEIVAIDQEHKSYSQQDQLVVMEQLIVLEAEDQKDLGEIDPKVTELSTQVTDALIVLSRSAEVKDLHTMQLTEEVMVLGEVISRIQSECPDDEKFQRQAPNFLQSMNVKSALGPENAAQYLLGIETDTPLEKLESYTFVEGEIIYYLYKGKKKNNEQQWVMAKLTKDGKLSFEHFRIGVYQPPKVTLKDDNDIALLKAFEQKDRSLFKNDRRLYIQAQEGLMIKADVVDAPVIGKAVIPEAKLVIGKLNMAYLTNKTVSQSNLLVEHDRMTLNLESKPLNGSWAVGGQVRYSPLKGDVYANANVRVQNLLLGFGTNSQGHSNTNISYVLNRNFLTFQTGSKSGEFMAIGRQFKNGKGFVSATTNFKQVHEVKLILLLQ